MQLSALRLGAEIFFLDAATAAEVGRLRATDPAGALALARRFRRSGPMPEGGSIRVPAMLTDAAPGTLPSIEGFTDMTTKTIVVDGENITAETHVIDLIQSLRGQNAALRHMAQSQATIADQQAWLADAARAAALAEERRGRDPKTARGAYIARLADAWKHTAA